LTNLAYIFNKINYLTNLAYIFT